MICGTAQTFATIGPDAKQKCFRCGNFMWHDTVEVFEFTSWKPCFLVVVD